MSRKQIRFGYRKETRRKYMSTITVADTFNAQHVYYFILP